MMANPLDQVRPQTFGGNSFSGMQVGETRTVSLPSRYDEKGRPDLSSMEPYTMTRTNRPFIYDWVDAVSNVSLDRKGRRDYRWIVVEGDQAQLVTRKEYERLLAMR
jgi:hypothetical protein